MFKTLWRIFVMLVFLLLMKNVFLNTQPQAYIVWPEKQYWIERVKFQVEQFQRDAQDLPASVEIQLRRFWKDVKPVNNAKPV